MPLVETLLRELEATGWPAVVVPYARRDEARQSVIARHERGELDEAFYREYLAPVVQDSEPEVPDPRSLILAAVPDRLVRFHFAADGTNVAVIVPPGYIRTPHSARTPLEKVTEILAPAGFAVARARRPRKAMAAMSHFARYGRNNITYVPGLGSFFLLGVFATDLPCEEAPAREPQMLPRCESCRACAAACPTGAIGEDRFLLHAERCLAFWNEKPPDVPFPDWIEPQWHNAFVGCTVCQEGCPENRAFLDKIVEGPSLDGGDHAATPRRNEEGGLPERGPARPRGVVAHVPS
ncbi:MAG: hypothetical protein NT125_07795 [Candidatus Bipolaricaulota bacterium]|nr:hypothetical protein [Candidatus Bipolaricaulota bacterium]